MVTKKLYVGNLPFKTTEEELLQFAQGLGVDAERAQIITNRDTGQSRGFAFITLAESAGVANAVKALNGQSLGGRALTVNEAQAKSNSGRDGQRAYRDQD